MDKATNDVEAVVVELRQGESRTRDEMREIRDEVENIREMLPKVIQTAFRQWIGFEPRSIR